MIKSKFITFLFQKYLEDKDIRTLKGNFFYYFIFRLFRKFLEKDIILNIYNFKVFGSINKNRTSYFLLKKCEFGDYKELSIIKKLSDKNKVLFIDCGSNYGFYSLYVASLHKEHKIISIEASRNTLEEFKKNLNLNNLQNIYLYNNAISNNDMENIIFNESNKDWESSLTHNEFEVYSKTNIQTIKIDTLVKDHDLDDFKIIIKLDIEGNEMRALQGSINLIKRASPLIIIEFSKYIFNRDDNIEYLKNFLFEYDYEIYNINNNKQTLDNILLQINNLKEKHKTIGNFYLIKNDPKIHKELFYE